MIYKHTYTLVVLSEAEDLGDIGLEGLAEAITTGEDIGSLSHNEVQVVPANKVVEELLAIGNDGGFFSHYDEENQE